MPLLRVGAGADFVAIKLASIAQHAREGISPDGHAYDLVAIKSLLDDPEVKRYMKLLDSQALLPVLR